MTLYAFVRPLAAALVLVASAWSASAQVTADLPLSTGVPDGHGLIKYCDKPCMVGYVR